MGEGRRGGEEEERDGKENGKGRLGSLLYWSCFTPVFCLGFNLPLSQTHCGSDSLSLPLSLSLCPSNIHKVSLSLSLCGLIRRWLRAVLFDRGEISSAPVADEMHFMQGAESQHESRAHAQKAISAWSEGASKRADNREMIPVF